jgi:hypothetical protein
VRVVRCQWSVVSCPWGQLRANSLRARKAIDRCIPNCERVAGMSSGRGKNFNVVDLCRLSECPRGYTNREPVCFPSSSFPSFASVPRGDKVYPAGCKQALNRRKRRQRSVRTEPKEEYIPRRLELRDSSPQFKKATSESYCFACPSRWPVATVTSLCWRADREHKPFFAPRGPLCGRGR